MSVAYSTFGFGGFGTGQSCGGARSVYFDDLTQRRTAADPLYKIANALPDYDTFQGDPSLIQATRDCFNENIDSLFEANTGGQANRTYGFRPELRQLREAIESTAGYFKETVDMVSDPQEARRMINEIVETLLSRVGAEEFAVPAVSPSQGYPEEACVGQYTEYDPWAETSPVTSKSHPPSPAQATTSASDPSKHQGDDNDSLAHPGSGPVDGMSCQLSSSCPPGVQSELESALPQRPTWISSITRPVLSSNPQFGPKPPYSSELARLSWLSSREDTFADEDEIMFSARTTGSKTDSDVDSFSPRNHFELLSSQPNFTNDSLDTKSGGATLSGASSSW